MTCTYQIGEIATLTGVSIRTLRHYDQIGLLRPSARTEVGYRLYGESDLLRLQQILTLRYLDFSLKEIGELLAQPELDQVAALRAQRGVLRDRIRGLQRLERTIGSLVERRVATGSWEWELVVAASAKFQQALEMGAYHMTPEERKRRFEELGKQVTPEEIAAVEQGWTALFADMRANPGLDPASPQAQAFGDRWSALIQQTFRGQTDLMQAVGEAYESGEFASVEGAPAGEDFAYIGQIMAARKAQS